MMWLDSDIASIIDDDDTLEKLKEWHSILWYYNNIKYYSS